MRHTVASTLLQYLYQRGVHHIFGIVGREASAILFNEQEGIEFILTRHEFTAGVMADVMARITGKPQVCFSTLGPGVTNLTTGVASACLDRSPVIALSAQVESYHMLYNQTHQCIDNVSIMKPLTKFASELTRPDDIVALLDQAFEAAMADRRGPSFLSLPIDLLKAEVSAQVASSAFTRPSHIMVSLSRHIEWQQRLDQVVDLLRSAKHPLLVAGSEVVFSGVSRQLCELSEQLNIPLVTPYTTKGILPYNHPLNYGAVSNYTDMILKYPALDAIFGPVDLLLTFGYDYAEDLRPDMWTRGVSKNVVRIAPIPNSIHQVFQPDVDVVVSLEDALLYLQETLSDVPKKIPHDISGVHQRVTECLSDDTEYPEGVSATQVISHINAVLGEGILVCDVGLFRSFAVLFSKINQPQNFITSSGCSTFGFALPAALAAKLAKPHKTVIALCGDGGFHSNSQDLETAVRYNLPVVIVVLNNNRNGLIHLYQSIGHQHTYKAPVNFGRVDFVGLAKANGCQGFYVSHVEQLLPTLRKAIALNKPTVIEVPVVYPDILS